MHPAHRERRVPEPVLTTHCNTSKSETALQDRTHLRHYPNNILCLHVVSRSHTIFSKSHK